MRRTRLAFCLLIAAAAVALPLTGCGGDDAKKTEQGTQLNQGGDRKGAENTVRDYLRALIAKDGAAACSKFTPEYQRAVLEKNEAFARKENAKTCADLITRITRVSRSVTFEGQPLNARTVDRLKLIVTLRQGGEEQNATVTGQQGLQRYELVTNDGKWFITEVVQGGR